MRFRSFQAHFSGALIQSRERLEGAVRHARARRSEEARERRQRRIEKMEAVKQILHQRKMSHHHHGHHMDVDHEERIVAGDLLSGINSSKMKVTLHPPVKGYIKGTFVRSQEVYQTSAITVSGQQKSFVISEIGGAANALGATNGHASPNDFAIPGYQIIPDTTMLAGSYYLTNIVDSKTQRFVLRHTELSVQFVSASSASATIRIYVCKAKQNIANQPTGTAGTFNRLDAPTYWRTSLGNESAGKGLQVLSPTGGGAPGYLDPNQPGSAPGDCRTFKKLYQIVGEHTIHLAANGVETWNLSMWNNQVFDVAKILELNNLSGPGVSGSNFGMGMLKGGYSVFATLLGQPAKDSGSGGTGQFTYAPVEVGCMVQRKCAWAGLKVKSENFVSTQAEDSAIGDFTGRNLKIVTASTLAPIDVTDE